MWSYAQLCLFCMHEGSYTSVINEKKKISSKSKKLKYNLLTPLSPGKCDFGALSCKNKSFNIENLHQDPQGIIYYMNAPQHSKSTTPQKFTQEARPTKKSIRLIRKVFFWFLEWIFYSSFPADFNAGFPADRLQRDANLRASQFVGDFNLEIVFDCSVAV